MLYVLIGAGSIGRALIRDVLDADKEASFLAVDSEEGALKAAAALDPTGRVATKRADATDPATLVPLLAGATIVINTTFGARCLEILDAAIVAKVAYMDVHGTLLMAERLERHDAAKAAGVTALIGQGVSPGLTNMLAGYGARKFSGPVEIDCEYVTHRPINPTEGLLETALRQFRDPVRVSVYEDGKFTLHPPFSGIVNTWFKGLDEEIILPYTPHSEPITVPRYVPNAKRVVVRGTYHKDIMALMKALSQFGLLNPELEITVNGKKENFQPLLRQALMGDGSPKPKGIKPLYTMRVRVSDGTRNIAITMGHKPGWDAAPQGRMTALPTAFAAQLVAHGEFTEKGICGPEQFTDAQVERCLAYLQARGLWIEKENL
jgi:lysine 6-dehydrogenase